MNLQENIRRILREDKKTKSTNKEFSKYKDSKFNSLRDYTLQDIVNNWESLSDHKNENIKTIRYFIDNPDKITDLVYDGKGLEDGYHRLIAAKILKKPKFTYRLVENLQESIRRILREETINLTTILRRVSIDDLEREFEESLDITSNWFFRFIEKNGDIINLDGRYDLTINRFINVTISNMMDGIHHDLYSTLPEDVQWYEDVKETLKDYYKDRIKFRYEKLISEL